MKQGDTVVIIENGEIKKGILKEIITLDRSIAIVNFNGEIRKVLIDDLAKVQEDNEEIQEDKEPVEKSEITITLDEFHDISINLITDKVMEMGSKGAILGMALTAFCVELGRALFINEVYND